MTTAIRIDRAANIIGSGLMIVSMAFFAVEDAFIKAAAATLPVGQIVMIFGIGGAAVFAAFAVYNKDALFVRDILSRPMRIRVVFEISGRLFYFLAITLTPLSAATVILQATPLVVVAGAAMVFGEKVGWHRWFAILVGLCGVIVIVQPGTDSFSALSIFAVIGMVGFAGRDLASRAAPLTLSTSALGFYGFLAVVVAGAVVAVWQGTPFATPNAATSLNLVGAILAGVAAYACLMRAMRIGEVSAVTPFRYTRLLFGISLGVLLFDETISSTMVLGAGLIAFSGLFILWRGKTAR